MTTQKDVWDDSALICAYKKAIESYWHEHDPKSSSSQLHEPQETSPKQQQQPQTQVDEAPNEEASRSQSALQKNGERDKKRRKKKHSNVTDEHHIIGPPLSPVTLRSPLLNEHHTEIPISLSSTQSASHVQNQRKRKLDDGEMEYTTLLPTESVENNENSDEDGSEEGEIEEDTNETPKRPTENVVETPQQQTTLSTPTTPSLQLHSHTQQQPEETNTFTPEQQQQQQEQQQQQQQQQQQWQDWYNYLYYSQFPQSQQQQTQSSSQQQTQPQQQGWQFPVSWGGGFPFFPYPFVTNFFPPPPPQIPLHYFMPPMIPPPPPPPGLPIGISRSVTHLVFSLVLSLACLQKNTLANSCGRGIMQATVQDNMKRYEN